MASTATYTYTGRVYEWQEEQGYYDRRTGDFITESWAEYQQGNIFQDEIEYIDKNRLW